MDSQRNPCGTGAPAWAGKRVALALAMLAMGASVHAAQFSGQVRAADQAVPGATVTATQGGAKVTAFTDENGRYTLELTPGSWQIEVSMFEFSPSKSEVAVSDGAVQRDWVLNMPKLSDRGGAQAPAGTASVAAPLPAAPGVGQGGRGARGEAGRGGGGRFGGGFPGRGPGGPGGGQGAQGRGGRQGAADAQGAQAQAGAGGRGGRGATGTPQGGFQSAAVRATPEGAQAASQQDEPPATDLNADADEAFLVNGSMSGGLEQSSDDETRRQRLLGGRGGPGGPGGPGGGVSAAQGFDVVQGMPPGMTASLTNDSLGLGGFGASAINGGFGVGAAAPPDGGRGGRGGGPAGFGGGAPAGFGGGAGGGGGGGGGGARGGGGGGRGGGGLGQNGGRGGQGGRGRGAFNGQFANFGNRRRTTPPVQGSVALTVRNSAFNAAPYSLNGQTAQKPYSANNTLNVNIGGPLHIPKLVNWQRAQYTITFSTAVNRNGRSSIGTVPTEAMKAGDFSQLLDNSKAILYDPLSIPRSVFPDNVIPVNRFDPVSRDLLQYFPKATYAGIVQNYRFVITDPNGSRNIGVRFNAPLNNKDRLNFNFQKQHQQTDSHQLFGYLDTSNGSGTSGSTGWSHSFRPRLNNSANVSYSLNRNLGTPYFAYRAEDNLSLPGTSGDPLNWGPPALSFTNFSSLSDGSPTNSRNQTLTFSDNLTYVARRKHNLTFGYTFNRLLQTSTNYQNARGSFSFSGLLTSQLDDKGQPVKGTGFDFADFLLGNPQTRSLRFGGSSHFRSWSTSAYAQDDFRVSARLTINLGLRYEYFAPYTERDSHLATLDVDPYFTAASVLTAGQKSAYWGDLPSSIVRATPHNFSPRFGLAWRPFARRNSLIRAGYSVFFSGSSYAQIASSMSTQPPFAKSGSLTTDVKDPFHLQDGFLATPDTLTNTYSIDPNFRIAYAQTWTVSIQHTLPHGLVLDTEYIGTKGTHLGILENPNRTTSIGSSTYQIANATSFSYQTYGASSTYHAGQIRLTRRLSRSMSGNSLYTYSKGIDDASSFNGTGGTAVQFLNNRALERGLSTFDQRHNLAVGFQLSSPVGVRGLLRNGGWRTKVMRGWNMNGTFNATTGNPLTAHVSGNLSNTGGLAGGSGSIRAEATGLPIHADGHPYFNPAAFTTPVSGQFGNAGRTTIPGLFRTSLNASMNRSFRFAESRRSLTFSINAQNVLNHVTITSVGTTVNSANYGLPTAASATRSLTLNSRFNF